LLTVSILVIIVLTMVYKILSYSKIT